VDAANPAFSTLNGVLFDKAQKTLLLYPPGAGPSYTIPDGVTDIATFAFALTTNLANVTFPSTVARIADEAFNSSGITNLVLPEGLLTVGLGAFYGCNQLVSATIPNSWTAFYQAAFNNCLSLTNYSVSGSNPLFSTLNGVVFDKTQTKLIAVPPGLSSYSAPPGTLNVGTFAFYSANLTNIWFPLSLTNWENQAVILCPNLTSVTFAGAPIPETGNFQGSSSVIIYVMNNAGFGFSFEGMPTAAWVDPEYTYNWINGTVYLGNYFGSGGAVVVPAALNGVPVKFVSSFSNNKTVTSVTIPNGVTDFGLNAFNRCSLLNSITISSTVTNISDMPFSYCGLLTNITIDPANPVFSSSNGILFDKSQTTLLKYPPGRAGDYAVPNGVTGLGDVAFFTCSNLTALHLPSTITSYGYGAFSTCPLLTTLTIPASVTSVGAYAFSTCPLLRSIYFLGDAPPNPGPVNNTGTPAVIYYLPDTVGWGTNFDGFPTALWNAQATSPAITAGQWGFSINGPTNATVVVEATTNLAQNMWLPVATNTLSSQGAATFVESAAPGAVPSRFYRLRSF
jgi:hypothetical protein